MRNSSIKYKLNAVIFTSKCLLNEESMIYMILWTMLGFAESLLCNVKKACLCFILYISVILYIGRFICFLGSFLTYSLFHRVVNIDKKNLIVLK